MKSKMKIFSLGFCARGAAQGGCHAKNKGNTADGSIYWLVIALAIIFHLLGIVLKP